MNICLVSSYLPQRCGIAAYTSRLARALTENAPGQRQVTVLAERGALDGADGRIRSLPVFERREDYVTKIVARASALGADVVHVQHSSDIFGFDDRLPRLLSAMRARGIRSAVTLHSVHSRVTAALERHRGVPDFHRRIGMLSDTLVVHGVRGMQDELVRQGVPGSKVAVIAHGTELIDAPGRSEARRLLGLPERGPLLLYFGFVHPQKSVHTLLFAMRHLAGRVPEATLCIAGSVQNATRVNRAYAGALRWLASTPALATRVVMRDDFSSDETMRALFCAADIVLLPYREGYGSESGVAHQAVGAGCLLLCSASPKFSELSNAIGRDIVVRSTRASAWARAIERLLRAGTRREELQKRIALLARETSWSIVAARHLALYDALVQSRRDIARVSA